MKIQKQYLKDDRHPYIFRHRYGTLTVFARDEDEAKSRAKMHGRGMHMVEEAHA